MLGMLVVKESKIQNRKAGEGNNKHVCTMLKRYSAWVIGYLPPYMYQRQLPASAYQSQWMISRGLWLSLTAT